MLIWRRPRLRRCRFRRRRDNRGIETERESVCVCIRELCSGWPSRGFEGGGKEGKGGKGGKEIGGIGDPWDAPSIRRLYFTAAA